MAKSNNRKLLGIIAILAVLVCVCGYWMATQYWYDGRRDWARDLWLPIMTNMISTSFVVLLIYLFPEGRSESEEEHLTKICDKIKEGNEDFIEKIADRVVQKIPPPTGIPVEIVMKLMEEKTAAPQRAASPSGSLEDNRNVPQNVSYSDNEVQPPKPIRSRKK